MKPAVKWSLGILGFFFVYGSIVGGSGTRPSREMTTTERRDAAEAAEMAKARSPEMDRLQRARDNVTDVRERNADQATARIIRQQGSERMESLDAARDLANQNLRQNIRESLTR